MLHSSAEVANQSAMGTVSPRQEYDYAFQFLKLGVLADQYPCVVTALKTAGLVSFNGEYAYIKDPSSNPVRIKITATDDKISAWEVTSCTATTQDRVMTGEATSTTATIMFKLASGTRTSRIDAIGLISEAGAWGSKVVDISDKDTGTNKGYRINLTQSQATFQATGTQVNVSGASLTYASASKVDFYGTKYASDTTAFGFGAGSARTTLDGITYTAAHWNASASTSGVTTSDHASTVSALSTYPYTGYTTGIATAPFSTSEVWDCTLGATFVDLTDVAVMTGTLATSVTACLVSP